MSKRLPAIAIAFAFLLAGYVPTNAAQQSADKQTTIGKKPLSKSDQRYFEDLAQANLAEVQMGKLAQSKAASSEVKEYAQHMVQDHGKKLDEQRAMAKAKNVSLPGKPEAKHQDAMKRLERLSGQEFDRAYMEQMVKDHEATLKLVKEIVAKAEDADLKAAAEKAAPDIEKHLEMAKKIVATTQQGGKVGSSK